MQTNLPPFQTKHFETKIDNLKTDIIYSVFENRIFIWVSQTKSMGSIISAEKDKLAEENLNVPTYSLTTLLGDRKRDQMYQIMARQIIEQISKTSNKTLLLAIATKNMEMDHLRKVLQQILKNKVW
ncbi:proteasome assembly chaperone 3 [Anaeramoeba flamelloides]|uniref:Proteasome assembly chaperone n=1 Tax=Anaeramoeba flamelloides TaxID=1746091 RepID=A0AAV7Z3Z2_9EUKA|nr:proteasome assembly chaperone [Anaeramoeba flamelloides]KAJ6230393.1 proteasome assembly chaperone 3 [Anaeramoeba flamelloides]